MSDMISTLVADSNYANAVGALASAFIAIFAFIVSMISLVVSVVSMKAQQKHNKLSVYPIPEVFTADYENSQRVKVTNNGSGPMIIQKLSVHRGTEEFKTLVQAMPGLPGGRHWTSFGQPFKKRSLQPGSVMTLLELSGDLDDANYIESRDIVRAALADITIRIDVTDIYSTKFPTYEKTLEWFGRRR